MDLNKPISDEEFLRRCNGKGLKQVLLALQHRALVLIGSANVPLKKSIYLPDTIHSACNFHHHLRNSFETSKRQQQKVSLFTLLFQKLD